MRFRIAKTRIVFDQLGAFRRQHQASVQNARKRRAAFFHAANGRLDNLFHDAIMQRRRHNAGRRISAHAARVGAFVAIEHGFVILSRCKRQNCLAIGQRKEAGFFALHKGFDDDLGAGIAKRFVFHRVFNSAKRFVKRLGHRHAFARGQTIGFDDNRRALCPDIGFGFFGILETRISRRGNRHARAQILHKAFRAFKLRRVLVGAKAGEARRAQAVGKPQRQGKLGADHDKINGQAAAGFDDFVQMIDRDRQTSGRGRNAGVAGRAIKFAAKGGFGKAPAQGMFARAGSDDEDVESLAHFSLPLAGLKGGYKVFPQARKGAFHQPFRCVKLQDMVTKRPTPPPPPDLFDAPETPRSNAPAYSVSDLSRLLKKTIEDAYGYVRVRGELGACKYHSSGHLYFSLKDESAVLDAVCWRGQVGRLSIRPEMGMDVICTGKLTTYAGSSRYQLVVESMTLAGQGALLKMLEDRRKKLAAEGLFDAARKKDLPWLPEVIGVVTSPTGAVIRDILHRLSDRFPRAVLLWPVPVQGAGAAEKIAAAIDGFNALAPGGAVPRPDVLIVARGGGSLEDLMPFNEECVVRAVANCSIPVISAVGHETDTTLVDFVADRRAPTPTAAAEMAVPVRADLLAQTLDDGLRLEVACSRLISDRKDRLALLAQALGDPASVLMPLSQRVDERSERLDLAMRTLTGSARAALREAAAKLRHPRDVVAMARQRLIERAGRLDYVFRAAAQMRRTRLAQLALRAPTASLALAAQRCDALSARLEAAGRDTLLQTEKKLDRQTSLLAALSPRAVLSRGYSLVHDKAGAVVTSAKQLKPGAGVSIEFHDGARQATVDSD